MDEIIERLQNIKSKLEKAMGYIPFFNEVGIQLILYSGNIVAGKEELKPVDTVNNQRALFQSIFVFDEANQNCLSAYTVIQTITSKIQSVIHQTILSEVCQ